MFGAFAEVVVFAFAQQYVAGIFQRGKDQQHHPAFVGFCEVSRVEKG